MFRIFFAPTVDESGQPLTFEDQRRLMIELDKFQQGCEYNTIRCILERASCVGSLLF